MTVALESPKRVGKVRYSMPDFARFCGELVLESGKSFRLEPFQRLILRDYFHGALETVILIPKKNGKTTLLAALALYHLRKTPSAECVIAAASRDQARILYNQAVKLIRRSGLEAEFDVKGGSFEIRYQGDSQSRIRVLAADANTADGVIPTLALVDELHRHKTGELYGVFRDGLGPRDGQLITISTAGADTGSPLGELRSKAHALGGTWRSRVHFYVRGDGGDFVLHEFALQADDDLSDIGLVGLANPASWQTRRALERRHDSPSTTPWQWARFACGIWTASEEPWINPAAWDACFEDGVDIPDGSSVYLGVDIGRKHDHTAVVALWRRADGRVVVMARVFVPPAHDGSIDLGDVERHILSVAERWNLLGVVYDPWSFERSAQLLSDEGLMLIEYPQSAERMHKASALLYEAIMNRTIVHDGDKLLTMHVQAGASKDTERGWRLVKNPNLKRPIDALIALAVGFTEAHRPAPTPFAFEASW